MNISIREIYLALVLMSIVSGCFLFTSTTKSVEANGIDIDNTTIINSFPERIVENREELSLESANILKQVEDTSQDENYSSEQKQESLAEIHSSFDETLSSSNVGKSVVITEASSHIAKPIPHVQVSNKLSETGRAVVFTLVDSAAVELQQRAASSPQQTDSLNLSDNLTATISPIDSSDRVDGFVAVEDGARGPNNTSQPGEDNETQAKVDEQYVVRAEPKVVENNRPEIQQNDDSPEVTEEPDKSEIVHDQSMPVTNGSFETEIVEDNENLHHSSGPEDIPSFSEWAQKQLAEAEEKKKVHNGTAMPTEGSSRSGNAQKTLKLRSKNYASPDCGAKIAAANPEAVSAGSVLSPSRDEYVLNTCTSRIWFVVELCEAIQAKKIDLANFELFSSSPREFSVHVADRFPSRDWRTVGQFTAEDERTIQSFNLNPHLFGKFVKVELHSHYGSEHFCPVSLFRVYGTSEFEVLETVDEVHETVPDIDEDDEDEDGSLDVDTGEPPQNLFNSARDAVMSIVKKAAEALGKGSDVHNKTGTINSTTEYSTPDISLLKNCKSPRHIVVCDNCSGALYSHVYQLLSCQDDRLQMLMESSFVSDVIRDSQLCSKYGLFFTNRQLGAPYPLRQVSALDHLRLDPVGYVSALFPPEYVAALCNMLAIFEKKVALNISNEQNTTLNIDSDQQVSKPNYLEQGFENVILQPAATCTIDNSVSSQPCATSKTSVDSEIELSTSVPQSESSSSDSSVASQINPTKTLEKEDDRQDTFPSSLLASSMATSVETVVVEASSREVPAIIPPPATATIITTGENGTAETTDSHTSEAVSEAPAVLERPPAKESDTVQGKSSENTNDASGEDQEQLTLDTLLLLDLKDLDQSPDSSSAPAVTTTSTVAPPSTVPAQQMQKESVFVRLANRIKALERNMSLSGQYLEELSRRYKKQMEEMQRAFNRTLAAMGEESRKGEEREQKHTEEMLSVQKQLATLSSAVEVLLSERDSWFYKANIIIQHMIFISVEVLICVLVIYFCRRLPAPVVLENRPHRKLAVGWKNNRKSSKVVTRRRKSVEGVSGHESPRVRNRRPSEEALNIAGTYHDLLITESTTFEVDGGTWTIPKAESRRKRRKKKELLMKSSSVNLAQKPSGRRSTVTTNNFAVASQSVVEPTRRASSSELGQWWAASNGVDPEEEPVAKMQWQRQESAPEPFVSTGGPSEIEELPVSRDNVFSSPPSTSGYIVELEPSHKVTDSLCSIEVRTKERLSSNSVPSLNHNNGVMKVTMGAGTKPRPLSSPLFMKTAVATRSSRRMGNSAEPSPQARLKSDNWEWYSSRRNTSSQGNTCAPVGQSHNGQLEVENMQGTSNGSEVSDLVQKENNKKGGPGSLRKIVNRFF